MPFECASDGVAKLSRTARPGDIWDEANSGTGGMLAAESGTAI